MAETLLLQQCKSTQLWRARDEFNFPSVRDWPEVLSALQFEISQLERIGTYRLHWTKRRMQSPVPVNQLSLDRMLIKHPVLITWQAQASAKKVSSTSSL